MVQAARRLTFLALILETGVVKISFTIYSRLKEVLKTPYGRKHLVKTWRWSLSQAFRAAYGQQISEVLHELDLFRDGCPPTLPQPAKQTIADAEFSQIAVSLRAGKQNGHVLAYRWLDLDRGSEDVFVLEVGIGTSDPSAASSMGLEGVPGSSLELWKAIFPRARVLAGDVDPKALVQGENIRSVLVDSTKQDSIQAFVTEALSFSSSSGFDLIVDDGLHTPESNLRLLRNLKELVRVGGFYIVEDIPTQWNGFWRVVATSMSPDFEWVLEDSSRSGLGAHSFLVLKRVR